MVAKSVGDGRLLGILKRLCVLNRLLNGLRDWLLDGLKDWLLDGLRDRLRLIVHWCRLCLNNRDLWLEISLNWLEWLTHWLDRLMTRYRSCLLPGKIERYWVLLWLLRNRRVSKFELALLTLIRVLNGLGLKLNFFRLLQINILS